MSDWIKAKTEKQRAPGCDCTHVIGGMSIVLATDGAPKGMLPAKICRCGRTAISIKGKGQTWHKK